MGLLLLIGVLVGIGMGYRALGRWLRGQGYRRLRALWFAIPLVLMGGCSVLMVAAIWPDEDFYRNEFQRLTGTPLPAETQFQHKDSTYPDQHGDYQAYAVVTVPDSAYRRIMERVARDTSWHR